MRHTKKQARHATDVCARRQQRVGQELTMRDSDGGAGEGAVGSLGLLGEDDY